MKAEKFCFSLFFILATILYAYTSWAQTSSVKGHVVSGATPVAFAHVFVTGSSIGTSSLENGTYILENIPPGTYTIVAYSLGFTKEEKTITLKENDAVILNFELVEADALLDEVVISGTMKEVSKLESTVPVDVYRAEFFKANPTPSVFESLQNVNGVRPQLNCNVCNTGDIQINGLEGPYTMVLIDGMPIVGGLSTVYGLMGIPQSLIERVEIVKGPASTLYGSEAVGGLINLITKNPDKAPLFSTDFFSTTWGEVNTDLGVKYKVNKNVQALLGLHYFNYQNPIDNNKDGITDATLQNRISIFNKFNMKRKENRVFSIGGRYVYEDRWGGEMNWEKKYRGGDEVYGESIYTRRWETFGLYQLPTSENINFQFSANGHTQNSVYGTTLYLADQYIGFAQLTWNKTVGKHEFLSGFAYRYNYYDDNTPATANAIGNSPSVTHLPGVFIQNELALNEQNKVMLGARYDYNNVHGNILSPRLNYKWTSPNKQNIFRFSVGNGYRIANVFTEDHAALTGARIVEFEEELRPETSWNGNMNFVKKIYTGNGHYIGLDASAFYTYFSNRILPDYDTDPNKIIYSNLNGVSESRGVSFNVDLALENGLKILVGTTFMNVTATENGKKFRPVLIERFQGVWSIGYTFNSVGITVDYTGNVIGPMRLPLLGELDNRNEYSPMWSLQNIQFTKKVRTNWEIYWGIKNILNYTPPANSIARSFDPFDKQVVFDPTGNVIPTAENPNALTFDPTYMFAPNQGIRGFIGLRYTFK
ncbi:MAG: TonB-dependent receptor [Flammeovirgaceae bacterium]|jgi:outer membrane receptor for ferrienterochelin and colicins|nr:TonB-dependent receptor [Flammeovirgaceae bacterium]